MEDFSRQAAAALAGPAGGQQLAAGAEGVAAAAAAGGRTLLQGTLALNTTNATSLMDITVHPFDLGGYLDQQLTMLCEPQAAAVSCRRQPGLTPLRRRRSAGGEAPASPAAGAQQGVAAGHRHAHAAATLRGPFLRLPNLPQCLRLCPALPTHTVPSALQGCCSAPSLSSSCSAALRC